MVGVYPEVHGGYVHPEVHGGYVHSGYTVGMGILPGIHPWVWGYLLVYTLWYTRVVYTLPTMLSRVHYARSPPSAHARRYPVVRVVQREESLGS